MGEAKAFERAILQPMIVVIRSTVRRVLEWPTFRRNRAEFQNRSGPAGASEFPFGVDYPCLDERRIPAGVARGAYFHHDLVVAQAIFAEDPIRHIDVGSRIDGFVAHVAAFREIEVIDIRPVAARVHNIVFRQLDVMNDDLSAIGTADSVSSLSVVEHFGLGRYGDPIDPDGWRRGLDALTRLTAPGGSLHIAVPIGPQRIEFDAHRVFSLPFLRARLDESFDIVRFRYVDDGGDLHEPTLEEYAADAESFRCWMGSGIFHLRRRPSVV